MYLCKYVCMYKHTLLAYYVCMNVSTYVCMHAQAHLACILCIYEGTYVSTYVYLYMCTLLAYWAAFVRSWSSKAESVRSKLLCAVGVLMCTHGGLALRMGLMDSCWRCSRRSCVCVCVCAYVYMYVCMHVRMYVFVCMYLSLHAWYAYECCVKDLQTVYTKKLHAYACAHAYVYIIHMRTCEICAHGWCTCVHKHTSAKRVWNLIKPITRVKSESKCWRI